MRDKLFNELNSDETIMQDLLWDRGISLKGRLKLVSGPLIEWLGRSLAI